jgi:transposase
MEASKPQIPLEVRYYVVAQVTNGVTYENIMDNVVREFGLTISKGTISNIMSKYRDHGTVEDLPRSGRPCKQTIEEETAMVQAVENNPKLNASQVFKSEELNPKHLSLSTVNRTLNQNGLLDYTSVPQNIREDNKANRLIFAETKASKIDWTKIIFSDESDLFPDRPGKLHYRKRRGETVDLNYGPESRWDPRKVKVWGTISIHGVGTLHRYEGTLDSNHYIELLGESLLRDFPLLRGTRSRPGKYLFQQDNARPHVSKKSQEYLESIRVYTVEWPSESPDLNPIENVWGFIKGELFKFNDELKDMEQTWEKIQEIWYNQVNFMVPNLYNSLSNRFIKVVEVQGARINC